MHQIAQKALSFSFARYLISGGTAASVHLGVLYVLVEMLGMHYLLASAIAMSIAVVVSFILHKFFTFGEHTIERIPHQFVRHITLFLCSLSLNTALMWILVERLGMIYLLAQVFAIGTVAIGNFFVYRLFIFHGPLSQSDIHAVDKNQETTL